MKTLFAALLLVGGLARLAPAAAQTKPRPATRTAPAKAPDRVYSSDEVTPC